MAVHDFRHHQRCTVHCTTPSPAKNSLRLYFQFSTGNEMKYLSTYCSSLARAMAERHLSLREVNADRSWHHSNSQSSWIVHCTAPLRATRNSTSVCAQLATDGQLQPAHRGTCLHNRDTPGTRRATVPTRPYTLMAVVHVDCTTCLRLPIVTPSARCRQDAAARVSRHLPADTLPHVLSGQSSVH